MIFLQLLHVRLLRFAFKHHSQKAPPPHEGWLRSMDQRLQMPQGRSAHDITIFRIALSMFVETKKRGYALKLFTFECDTLKGYDPPRYLPTVSFPRIQHSRFKTLIFVTKKCGFSTLKLFTQSPSLNTKVSRLLNTDSRA